MAITSSKGTRSRARITSQGQITVPKAIRDRLGLKPGDDVEFADRDGEIVLVPRRRRSILEFAGVLPPPPGVVLPKSNEEWERMISDASAEAAVRRHERVLRQAADGRADRSSG
jgi:AbrB family looped-hinge helix DNA binding protein